MPRRIVEFRKADVGRYWERFAAPNWPTLPGRKVYSCPAWGYEDKQISTGHPFRQLGKSKMDIGGEFRVVKHTYREGRQTQPRVLTVNTSPPVSGNYVYDGPLFAYTELVTGTAFPASAHSSKSTLGYYGTKAIALTIPTNPLWDLSTFVGELREGLPSLVGVNLFKDRTLRAKNAGGEYLNFEFGWRPLVNDVRSFSNAVSNSDKVLKQYERNSGKRVKRALQFPTERSISVTKLNTPGDGSARGFPRPVLPNGIVQKEGTLTRTTVTERKMWFKGCFTYYLPPLSKGKNTARNVALANKLYGVRLTPETLWNLTPWSWGADWLGNFGDVIHNVNAFANDGLVMPYAYIMEHVTVHVTYELVGVRFYSTGTKDHNFRQEFVTETKSRLPASPFGFGLNPSIDFSGRQWAILGALGLSKGSKLSW